jgi:hypothetical protein
MERRSEKMDYYHLNGCKARHVCYGNSAKRGWCLLKSGHLEDHVCGECASPFGTRRRKTHAQTTAQATYTCGELIGLIKTRISRYEHLCEEQASRRIPLSYAIDELLSLIVYLEAGGVDEHDETCK